MGNILIRRWWKIAYPYPIRARKRYPDNPWCADATRAGGAYEWRGSQQAPHSGAWYGTQGVRLRCPPPSRDSSHADTSTDKQGAYTRRTSYPPSRVTAPPSQRMVRPWVVRPTATTWAHRLALRLEQSEVGKRRKRMVPRCRAAHLWPHTQANHRPISPVLVTTPRTCVKDDARNGCRSVTAEVWARQQARHGHHTPAHDPRCRKRRTHQCS